MKLEPGTLVKNLPYKLRELVLEELINMGSSKTEKEVLEGDINFAFVWDKTTQGHKFWSDIYHGREIPDEFLEEETYSLY